MRPPLEFAARLDDLKKAAITLVALGPVDGAKILRNIPEKEADLVARAIAELGELSTDEVSASLEEFNQLMVSDRLLIKGGLEYAEKMLTEAYGATVAKQLLSRLMRSMGSESATFENFSRTDPLQLARLVQDEHPQTIALVLSHLKPGQAAALLRALPSEVRSQATSRMADLEQISPEVIRNIASVIDQKLQNVGQLSREAYGGVRAVAEIFNRLDAKVCSQLMTAVEGANKTLFDNIREYMFVFRDLENLDGLALGALMQRAERGVLLTALKGTHQSLRDKFLATQSQRGAAMMREELESMGALKRKDVDAAQQSIIALARELEKEGTISLSAGADEQYVN
jgi:flagellar motor switch protein FliG